MHRGIRNNTRFWPYLSKNIFFLYFVRFSHPAYPSFTTNMNKTKTRWRQSSIDYNYLYYDILLLYLIHEDDQPLTLLTIVYGWRSKGIDEPTSFYHMSLYFNLMECSYVIPKTRAYKRYHNVINVNTRMIKIGLWNWSEKQYAKVRTSLHEIFFALRTS